MLTNLPDGGRLELQVRRIELLDDGFRAEVGLGDELLDDERCQVHCTVRTALVLVPIVLFPRFFPLALPRSTLRPPLLVALLVVAPLVVLVKPSEFLRRWWQAVFLLLESGRTVVARVGFAGDASKAEGRLVVAQAHMVRAARHGADCRHVVACKILHAKLNQKGFQKTLQNLPKSPLDLPRFHHHNGNQILGRRSETCPGQSRSEKVLCPRQSGRFGAPGKVGRATKRCPGQSRSTFEMPQAKWVDISDAPGKVGRHF